MPTTDQMQQTNAMIATSSHELEQVINNAIKKVGANKENDLCHYLPGAGGGYMHHFTMKKMKHQMPAQLAEMLQSFIIKPSKPLTVMPKQRAARGSKKKNKAHFVVAKQEMDKLLGLVRAAGDKDLMRKLLPQKDLRTLKKELLSSIRQNRIEPELWHSYTEMVSQQPAQ